MRRPATVALALLALSGCAGGDEDARPTTTAAPPPAPPPTATPTQTAPPGATETAATPVDPAVPPGSKTVLVYFLRDGKLAAGRRVVAPTPAVARAAVDALSRGPTRAERKADFQTRIDPYMIVGALTIRAGTATIRLQPCPPMDQVVYTLTQFPTVKRVKSPCLGGRTMSRDDLESVTPAILVESPTVGDSVRSPLRIRGSANTFEATFVVNVVDADGRVVADQPVTATSGSGTRGTFAATVAFEIDRPGGKLVAFEESAKDGSRINVVEIPLRLQPG